VPLYGPKTQTVWHWSDQSHYGSTQELSTHDSNLHAHNGKYRQQQQGAYLESFLANRQVAIILELVLARVTVELEAHEGEGTQQAIPHGLDLWAFAHVLHVRLVGGAVWAESV
jgi:hypothetical protein